MMPIGSEKRCKTKGYALVSPAETAQENRQVRQAALQTPQPYRDHVRQAQGLAVRGDPLRQVSKGLPVSHRSSGHRHLLVVKLNEC